MGLNFLKNQGTVDCVESRPEFKQLISCLLMPHVDIAIWHIAPTKK